jgi:hypothetical protein
MANIGYHSARIQGQVNRSIYRAALPWLVKLPIEQTRIIPVAVYAFSCERDLPEQVASIRSFIRYVGVPDSFTVVSDGSYSRGSRHLLSKISSCVNVLDLNDIVNNSLHKFVYDYASQHPLGKKLSILMSMPIEKPTIYADSDILFFPGADTIINIAQLGDQKRWYLPDCAFALDARLLDDSERAAPVNSGFMLLKQPLDWDIPLERLERIAGRSNYFTEQTMVHLAMHNNKAIPLCSSKFIVALDDQFIYSDKYADNSIALRHYVNPVRHKIWCQIGI